MNKIVIGIDQSYRDTGVALSFNGELKSANHIFTEKFKTNSEKRLFIQESLNDIFYKVLNLSEKHNAEVIIIIERIRLRSQGFLNINYIKGIGALNALITDLAYYYNYPVFSVDTRAWKSAVIGNSKGKRNNIGFDEKKYPTLLWCIKNGYEKYIIEPVSNTKKKGVIERNGERFTYNDNTADAICISLYGFTDKQLLAPEH